MNTVSFFRKICGAVVKNPPADAGDTRNAGLIPGSGRSPGVGNGNSLQYSCLENSRDRGVWGRKEADTTDHTHTPAIYHSTTDTHTHSNIYSHTHNHTYTPTHSSHTHLHALKHSRISMNACPYTFSHMHVHIHTHTLSHTLTHQ